MVRFGTLVVLAACSHAPHPPLAPAPVAACSEAPRPVETKGPIEGPVAHVTITGPGSQLPEVFQAVHTEAGNLFDPEILRQDVRRLWELDIASQIDVAVTDADDGPDVALTLVAPPRIARVVGGEAYPEVAALRALEGTLYDAARTAKVATLTEAALVASGYTHAHVRTAATIACGQATLRLDVDAGRQFRIAELVVAGSALPVERTSFERDLGHANVVGGVFDAPGFEADLATWIERHRGRGWVDAKASAPVIDYDAAHARVSVHATITPGPRFQFGRLPVDGGDARARGIADAGLAALRGTPYDAEAYDAAVERLHAPLVAAGYVGLYVMTADTAHHVVEVSVSLRPVNR